MARTFKAIINDMTGRKKPTAISYGEPVKDTGTSTPTEKLAEQVKEVS